MPAEAELRERLNIGPGFPYDFGFLPAMTRLAMSHQRFGPFFGQLFAQIMFSPEGRLSRREREMIAAVTAAAQDCLY
jgi:hypothetical protein